MLCRYFGLCPAESSECQVYLIINLFISVCWQSQHLLYTRNTFLIQTFHQAYKHKMVYGPKPKIPCYLSWSEDKNQGKILPLTSAQILATSSVRLSSYSIFLVFLKLLANSSFHWFPFLLHYYLGCCETQG